MGAYTAGIAPFYHEVPIYSKGNTPTVPDDPVLFGFLCLPHDRYCVVEGLFRAVSVCFSLLRPEIRQLSWLDCYHRCDCIALTELVLNSLTIFLG